MHLQTAPFFELSVLSPCVIVAHEDPETKSSVTKQEVGNTITRTVTSVTYRSCKDAKMVTDYRVKWPMTNEFERKCLGTVMSNRITVPAFP